MSARDNSKLVNNKKDNVKSKDQEYSHLVNMIEIKVRYHDRNHLTHSAVQAHSTPPTEKVSTQKFQDNFLESNVKDSHKNLETIKSSRCSQTKSKK